MRVAHRGGSPKKKTGVLILGDDPKFEESKIVDALRGKVRTVEYRPNGRVSSEYFRYFVHVMEGRFTPGVDQSFSWTTDPAAAKQQMKTGRRGGFLYFYSASDKSNEAARQLQNRVFFDANVRSHGRKLVPILVEREKNEDLFSSFELKSTPAVVVLDADFRPLKVFQGKIAAKPLAKALRKAGKGR